MTDEQPTQDAPAAPAQPDDEAAIDLDSLLSASTVNPNEATCRQCIADAVEEPRVLLTTGGGDFPTMAAQHYVAKHGLTGEGAIGFDAFVIQAPATADAPARQVFWAQARLLAPKDMRYVDPEPAPETEGTSA